MRRLKFTHQDIIEIRTQYVTTKATLKALARTWKCAPSMISQIVDGSCYPNAGGPIHQTKPGANRKEPTKAAPEPEPVKRYKDYYSTPAQPKPPEKIEYACGWTDESLDRLEAHEAKLDAELRDAVQPGVVVYLRSHPTRLMCVQSVKGDIVHVNWLDDRCEIRGYDVSIHVLGVHLKARRSA